MSHTGKTYPTAWQQKMLWAALTAVAITSIGALSVGLIWLVGRVLAFLQPLLLPMAIAGVAAYLLDPAVAWLQRFRLSRLKSVILVFAFTSLLFASVCVWVGPALYFQGLNLARKMPGYISDVYGRITEYVERNLDRFGVQNPFSADAVSPEEQASRQQATPEPVVTGTSAEPAPADLQVGGPISIRPYIEDALRWLQAQIPTLTERLFSFLKGSVGGFLGVFGYLVSLVLVPVYLFFMLRDAHVISTRWSEYLPLRASHFKDEVVASVTEINGYLIAFFRGQLLVSMIDGVLTGIGLMIMGLDFALLIGLLVAVLALVPYIGILLCWIPAVIIAAVQWGDWQHPLIVTAIFIGVQQIEGLFISPKIVGDSVGLHPMTVIVSVIAWSLLLGGLLGAVLSVPLTATLKVLLKRYVWEKKRPKPESDAPASAKPLPATAGGST